MGSMGVTRIRWMLVLVTVSLLAAPHVHGVQTAKPPEDGQSRAEADVVGSMAHHHHSGDDQHLRLTPQRTERPGDRERASAIVSKLGPVMNGYRDYNVAIKDSYRIFLPQIPQPEYHFTNYQEGRWAAFAFSPEHPTSLLYEKTKDGYRLTGAMYTAPRSASEEELDRRVPLSIARWHRHVNICVPPRGTPPEAVDLARFGAHGSITTAEACAAAGGWFFEQVFGWMVHVYPFEKTLARQWRME